MIGCELVSSLENQVSSVVIFQHVYRNICRNETYALHLNTLSRFTCLTTLRYRNISKLVYEFEVLTIALHAEVIPRLLWLHRN